MMKNNLLITTLVALVFITACRQPAAPADSPANTGYKQAPLAGETKPLDSLHHMDTSVMVVDSMSHITFNGTPLQKSDNSIYNTVYDSWLQDYHASKHLPLAFKLVQQGTVMMGIRGNIGDAVIKAQDDMKNYIARDKFKKTFAQLDSTEKDNFREMHPILFKRPF